jgi:hypothetical protein
MVPEESQQPEARIADADRDQVVAQLRLHCTEGRITLDEFSDRVGLVYNAHTFVELDHVVHDLPVPWSTPPVTSVSSASPAAAASRARRAVRWKVAIFGDNRTTGRFRLDEESAVVALFGNCIIDLSEATIDRSEVVISAVAAFGNITIIVPEGIEVDLQGFALFGNKSQQASGPVLPGSPVVVVRALAAFGDVRVRPPQSGRARRWRTR